MRTPVALRGVPGGPSQLATNPAGGWVVSYTPQDVSKWSMAPARLALVDPSGSSTPFGATYPPSAAVTGLAVSPDGARVAVALMNAYGATPASITVMPLPGHSGAMQTWTADDADVNEIDDVSWAADGTRLTYIAGSQTGGGIGGDPVTLDTSVPGKAPTQPSWPTEYCGGTAVSWLGLSGQLAVVRDCMGGAVFSVVDPKTGEPEGSSIDLPGHGCMQPEIHPAADGATSLVVWCGVAYLIKGDTATASGDHLTDAAWGG